MIKFFLYESMVVIWCTFISMMAKTFYANSICPTDKWECVQNLLAFEIQNLKTIVINESIFL